MSSTNMTNNQREGLYARSTVTGKQEYLSSTANILNVNASVSISGVATAANQTNGTQKTQIVDGSGNVVGSTTNALDVNIKSGGGGSVTQGTSPWIVAGGGTAGSAATGVVTVQGIASMTKLLVTPDSVALPANQSVNVSQINAVTPLMGNGVTGTGSQRVTIASDNTAFAVNATLSAETTKVIGVTRTADGSGNLLTSTTNALDVNLKTSAATNISTNVAQMNGVAVTMGNGASGTGVQRVTIANDSTGILATVTNVATIGTSVTPGTGATNLGKAEDAPHTTGDVGVMALGVRNDTLASTTNASADYTQLSTDTAGIVMTAGAPRLLKGKIETSVSNTTSETTVLAATASTFHDVYGLILANTGASTTKVSVRDTTAGTVFAVFEVPTLDTRGFMVPVDSAIPQATVNTNWTVQCGTATTALEVTVLYVSRV